MPSLELLAVFALAALVMNLSPGPSNLYVMARSIGQGTAAGVIATLGLALGSMVHVVATTLGVAAVFAYSPLAYSALKVAGAGYLIYLGIRYLTAKPDGSVGTAVARRKSYRRILWESLLVEVTNPKTALFFLALLPQFASVEAGPVAPQLLVLGLIVTLSALPCDLAVAAASGRVAGWMAGNERAQVLQRYLSGTILVGLGGYILFDEAAE